MNMNEDSVIAVIGAGAMGSGIAQVAAQVGHRVALSDSNTEALERSRKAMASGLERLVVRGKMNAADKDAILGRINWTSDLTDVAPAKLVIEAIIENLDIKAVLFARLGEIVAPDAIIASNTSSLSITEMARSVNGPQRFVGLHFFNPVPVMKLVEVVPGLQTDECIVDALLDLMKHWGKVGVRVRDVPGFIVNRVARPYYAEGFAAWGEGIDAALIDSALQDAGGFRMGPLALADMIGHDVNYVVARSVYDAYKGQTRFRPQPSQQVLFESGMFGNKSGKGIYDHNVALPQPVFEEPGVKPEFIRIALNHAGIEGIVTLARIVGLTISSDGNLPPNTIRIDDIVIGLGDGRMLETRADVDVVLDHARDYDKSPSWVFSARDDRAASIITGFAHLLGKKMLRIKDRPGQIVLRTLAQLANSAADAVKDNVATADDINAAMRYGANHPEGPLEWACRYRHQQLSLVMDHIADELGDDIYRPSSFFKGEA